MEIPPSMLETQYVRIYCDYCCQPVWGPRGFNESLEDLPVTEDLRRRLQAWADQYSDFVAWEDYGAKLDVDAFNRTGRALAEDVRAQLPDWTVEYVEE